MKLIALFGLALLACGPVIAQTETLSTMPQVMSGMATRHHPCPAGWTGHAVPAASNLAVSREPLRLTVYDGDIVNGYVEARIATEDGLYYMIRTSNGLDVVRADSITDFSMKANPALFNHVFSKPTFSNPAAPLVPLQGFLPSSNTPSSLFGHRVPAAKQAADTGMHIDSGSIDANGVYHRTYVGFVKINADGTITKSPNEATGDYSKPVGSAFDPVLSTGWSSGHGARTQHVHTYYRHTKTGRTVHVHSYYRSHR